MNIPFESNETTSSHSHSSESSVTSAPPSPQLLGFSVESYESAQSARLASSLETCPDPTSGFNGEIALFKREAQIEALTQDLNEWILMLQKQARSSKATSYTSYSALINYLLENLYEPHPKNNNSFTTGIALEPIDISLKDMTPSNSDNFEYYCKRQEVIQELYKKIQQYEGIDNKDLERILAFCIIPFFREITNETYAQIEAKYEAIKDPSNYFDNHPDQNVWTAWNNFNSTTRCWIHEKNQILETLPNLTQWATFNQPGIFFRLLMYYTVKDFSAASTPSISPELDRLVSEHQHCRYIPCIKENASSWSSKLTSEHIEELHRFNNNFTQDLSDPEAIELLHTELGKFVLTHSHNQLITKKEKLEKQLIQANKGESTQKGKNRYYQYQIKQLTQANNMLAILLLFSFGWHIYHMHFASQTN